MKIPQYEAQINTPNPPQFNQIADVRNNDLGMLADGLGEIYKIKLREDEEAKKTAFFQADNSIKMGIYKAKADLLDKIKNGGAYAEAESEYQKAHDEIINKYSPAFDADKSGNTKLRAVSEYQADGLQNLMAIRDAATSRRKSDTVDSANNMVDILKNEYAFSKNPEVRKSILDKMTGTYAKLSATGVVSPDEGKLKMRQSISSAEQDRLKLFTQENSTDTSLAELEASKEIVGVDYYTSLKENLVKQLDKEGSSTKVISTLSGLGGQPSFDLALNSVLKEEGLSFVADDAGAGPTIYGVNSDANPEEYKQIMDLRKQGRTSESIALAKQVYKNKYWDAIGGDKLPSDIAHVAMDIAVVQGQGTAKRLVAEANGDINKLTELRKQAFIETAKNPEKAPYLNTWLARADRVSRQVSSSGGLPEQKDVDVYFETVSTQMMNDPVSYEKNIVNVSVSTGYIPSQVKTQAISMFNFPAESMKDSDAQTVATMANVISTIDDNSYRMKEGQLPEDVVAKANIIKSRIDSGVPAKEAVADMQRITKDKNTMQLYKEASSEAQKVAMGKKLTLWNNPSINVPKYANSDWMKSYAVHRSLGATPSEAGEQSDREINKKFSEFNGVTVRDAVTKYDTRFSEDSWIKITENGLKSLNIKPPIGAKVAVVADNITKEESRKYINPKDKNNISYSVRWVYDEDTPPVQVYDNNGNPLRIRPSVTMSDKKDNKYFLNSMGISG